MPLDIDRKILYSNQMCKNNPFFLWQLGSNTSATKLLFPPIVFPVGKRAEWLTHWQFQLSFNKITFESPGGKTPPLNQKVNPLLSELKVKMSSKIFLGWLLGIIVRRVPWLLDLTCILAKQETAPNIHFWFRACTPCYRAVLYLLKPLAPIWDYES